MLLHGQSEASAGVRAVSVGDRIRQLLSATQTACWCPSPDCHRDYQRACDTQREPNPGTDADRRGQLGAIAVSCAVFGDRGR
jgi:hypothetical protein